jgi:hypothetical protein
MITNVETKDLLYDCIDTFDTRLYRGEIAFDYETAVFFQIECDALSVEKKWKSPLPVVNSILLAIVSTLGWTGWGTPLLYSAMSPWRLH